MVSPPFLLEKFGGSLMSIIDRIFGKKEEVKTEEKEHLVSDSAGQEGFVDVAPVEDLKYESE